MAAKTVVPILGAKSFSCPNCQAISHQTWFRLFEHDYEKDSGPWMPDPQVIQKIESDHELEDKAAVIKYFKRKISREVFREVLANGEYSRFELVNLYASLCYSCDRYSIWVADKLIYPSQKSSIVHNEDMPLEIQKDFFEAANIVESSPRGAAALLRLCVQKLMVHLELKGKSIDDDIGALVRKGLDSRVQKALDIVRVVGNNAVHPGQIDLRDDKATAMKLFDLVNIIVEATISTPKHIQSMYDALPNSALKAIERRDGNS